MAMVSIDAGVVSERKPLGERLMDWMVRVGEMSAAGRAAQRYAKLNALSDLELAKRGMKREELLDLCFGYVRRG